MESLSLLYILTAITGLFYLLLFAKAKLGYGFCAICLAVSLSWAGLLGAKYLYHQQNDTALAVLMGESTVGIYYLLTRRLPKSLLVFRLPILLTMTYGAVAIVTENVYLATVPFLAGIWLLHLVLYLYRHSSLIGRGNQELIDCCED